MPLSEIPNAISRETVFEPNGLHVFENFADLQWAELETEREPNSLNVHEISLKDPTLSFHD